MKPGFRALSPAGLELAQVFLSLPAQGHCCRDISVGILSRLSHLHHPTSPSAGGPARGRDPLPGSAGHENCGMQQPVPRFGFDAVLDECNPEFSTAMEVIAARVLDAQSKLATTRTWDHSTLGELFGSTMPTRTNSRPPWIGWASASRSFDPVEQLQHDFGLQSVIVVGDRGMTLQKQVEALRERAGMAWITAHKSGAIRQLAAAGAIQMDLFDERNLFACSHDDLPRERLIACRNPSLAHHHGWRRSDG